ncbi:MAG: hypothetical protein CMF38_00155 [Legionellaceae bacterium]|nr:hypothetical protein [Legionellaceae bacterium]HAF87136.1 hypothetical protein [Legionellales bacterium]HCA88937.1 hypothetical protein [Legionellales bacterium]|tara:strand:+ start:63 stop:731 length:669 start_codon:yes stop_codon:yes gene_type:complete
MNLTKTSALIAVLASATSFAGTMGEINLPERLLLLEAGAAYSHSFYTNSATFPETITPAFPSGVAIDPARFYPNNFWGGYIGSSIYFPTNWLINTRLDMFASESKANLAAGTRQKLSPVHFSLSVDKVLGDFNAMSFGLGAGAIFENVNDGNMYVTLAPNNPPSQSVQGRTRIDPLVEAFVMYRFDNNFGVKFNAAYQIPLNNKFSNGDLNLNLGLNYSFPI